MSDDESQESLDYLQSKFDPASLTVPRLRSILVSHDIPYPSGAKKPQLIEIFTDKVLPQSRKILSARSRARRTSKGITNADRSDAGALEEDDQPILPPPSTTRPKSARKPSAKLREDTTDSEPRTRTRSRSPVKQTPRVTSAKHPRATTEDSTPEPDTIRRTVRKTRKSEAPVVKSEDLDDDYPRSRGAVFSHDNPFQSGSSPISSSRSPSGEGRRRTLHETPVKRKSSATPRRRTADVQQSRADDGITPPSSATFELTPSLPDHSIDFDDHGVETSEEFTPEEQLQLDTERAAGRATAVAKRPKKKSSGGFSAKGPLWVVFLTMLGGYAAWYRQEKLAVGYCGVGRPAAPIVSGKLEHLPDWAVALAEPECEPCPQHAFCYERLETACEPDFVLKAHPLSLGGVVPLPPTCEPDGEKVRRIKVVADRAVEELRERRAKFECGAKEGGEVVKTVEIGEEELKKKVSEKRRRGMGQAEFEELWAGAIGEIMGREEVEVVKDE